MTETLPPVAETSQEPPDRRTAPVIVVTDENGREFRFEDCAVDLSGGALVVARTADDDPVAIYADGHWRKAAEEDADVPPPSWFRHRLAAATQAFGRILEDRTLGDAQEEARILLAALGVPVPAAAPVSPDLACAQSGSGEAGDGRHPDGCKCQFCREDEREELARQAEYEQALEDDDPQYARSVSEDDL